MIVPMKENCLPLVDLEASIAPVYGKEFIRTKCDEEGKKSQENDRSPRRILGWACPGHDVYTAISV